MSKCASRPTNPPSRRRIYAARPQSARFSRLASRTTASSAKKPWLAVWTPTTSGWWIPWTAPKHSPANIPCFARRSRACGAAAWSAGNLKTLAAGSRWGRYGGLVARVGRIRGYGDFLHYHLLAAGKIDAVIESDVNILDIAACVAIVSEAGGHFTDLGGAPITLQSNSVLATNGRLHAPILAALS